MHPISTWKGKERGSALSELRWRTLAFTTVNRKRAWIPLNTRFDRSCRLRWWNTVSVYHRLWLPSASSPMGRPQIRHIRTAVESWRKYSRISSPVPVIAELSLLFCGRRNRSSSGASRNRKNHDTRLDFCSAEDDTGVRAPFIPRLWSTTPEVV